MAANKLHGAEINGVVRASRRRRGASDSGRDRPVSAREAPIAIAYDPRRRGRARGRRRRRGASSTRPARGSASGSTWTRARRPAGRRSTRTASRSGAEDVEACRRCRRDAPRARSADRAGTTRRARARPSRPCSPCAADSACSPTCARSPSIRRSSRPRRSRPELLDGVDLPDRARADRGPLLRPAVRGARRPTTAAAAIDTLAYTRARRSSGSSRSPSSWPADRRGRLTSVDKANVLATIAPVAQGRRRGPRATSRTSPSTHRLVDSCGDDPRDAAGRASTSSSPRTCSATSSRTRRRCSPARSGMLPSASLGTRSDRARALRPVRADPRLARPTSPGRTWPTRWARSCRARDAAALVAGPSPRRRAVEDGRGPRARRRLPDRRPAAPHPEGRSVGHRGLVAERGRRAACLTGARPAPVRRRRWPAWTRLPTSGHPLRHDAARRHPGREHHRCPWRTSSAIARMLDEYGMPVHRGRLAGLQPQGHRVLRGRPRR